MSRTYRNVPTISGPEGTQTLKWVKIPKNSKANQLSHDPKEISGAKEDWKLRKKRSAKALNRVRKAKFIPREYLSESWNPEF